MLNVWKRSWWNTLPNAVKSSRLQARLAGLFLLFLYDLFDAPCAKGRFLKGDLAQVDPEERLNSENFNDEISYRPPIHWEKIYAESSMAVRLNAGSYNSDRSMYEEDIKLISPQDLPMSVAFLQERQHNLLGDFNDRQYRITFHQARPMSFSILADGDSFKREADFGVALGFAGLMELYYWNVDPLYNKKKDGVTNHIDKPTRTWGIKYAGPLISGLNFSLKAELDSPLKFSVGEDNTFYEYEKTDIIASISQGTKNDGIYWDLTWHGERKREAKTFFLDAPNGVRKSLGRVVQEWEARIAKSRAGSYHWTNGILHYARAANYKWQLAGISEEEAEFAPEQASPNIRRDESGAYSTFFARVPPGSWHAHGYQFGLFYNHVRINSNSVVNTTNEVKFQAAWAYHITDTVQSFLNASFNIDGIYSNLPYDDKEFKPWDGGTLNIIAAF